MPSSRILDAEVAGSGGSVDSSDASRFHAGSFASASPLSGGVRRPAQSAQAVAAPPMASPINKPFINAAVTTADARTSFIDISLEPNRRTARQCLTIPLGFRPHPAVCRPAWLRGSARHGFWMRKVCQRRPQRLARTGVPQPHRPIVTGRHDDRRPARLPCSTGSSPAPNAAPAKLSADLPHPIRR